MNTIYDILSLTKLILIMLMIVLYIKYYIFKIKKKESDKNEIIETDIKENKK